ncbi:hypothetical protein HYPSUDRAFT_138453, partial [Hypholoma sublateritium FD-334 SS-4]
SKATKAEYAKDYDQAFRLYLKAAEYFLHISRSTQTTEKNKQQWKVNARKCLERAEKIKTFSEPSRIENNAPTAQPSVRLTPIGIDHFSPQEQFYILKKGSKVNNTSLPIWDDPAAVNISPTHDPHGQPTLSPEQEKVHSVWRRPVATLMDSSAAPARSKVLPQQILQHIVTDCSVCASISVCLEHGRRFESSLESALRGSFESTDRTNGRYDVRMLFNGTWRRVLIDDHLPYHPTEGTLMCMSVLPRPETPPNSLALPIHTLWPSLLEKAYMKLMGGYDFPGSNSSIDLHALAGWIPEHVDLQGSSFERETTWERIESGFTSGDCVVTLGTGPAANAQWRNTPLLPSHSYAVIDVYENANEGRILSVLDTWVRPDGGSPQSARELQIPWNEVLNTFNGVYLSWDPRTRNNSLNFHGIWKRNSADEEGTRHLQIEFDRSDTRNEEIWILLTRHIVDTHRTSDFAALRVELEDDLIPTATIVENQRTLSSKGTYTNSTHILVRKRIPTFQKSGVLSISASYDGDAREVGFTLAAYAEEGTNISWVDNKVNPPYTDTITGTFTSKTSGGNCTYPTYMINPQYQLTIRPHTQLGNKAKVTLNLHTNRDTPTNVAMVWSQNERVTELSEKDLVATSGAYNYGSARIAKSMSVGTYVVVVSAFEPHHTGPFSLQVESSHAFDMKPIPQEGAGMYCKTIRGAWNIESAGGSPSFNKYAQNPVYELEIPSTTQVKFSKLIITSNRIRLHTTQPSGAIALNITIYPNCKDDIIASLKSRHIATSGAYDDSIAGVVTSQFSLGPGKYYIIPSTYNPGTTAAFRMLVYSRIPSVKVNVVGRL